jgi:NAD(P)-dependent dehydrogenase (short-subunit alcohol dehydrogenase family)
VWAWGLACRIQRGRDIIDHMQVAIITGAAQGIGRQIAQVLAARGYALALNDLRSPAETTALAQGLGAGTLELVGDISDESAVQLFAEQVIARWGRVDVLVNNAGISCISPAEMTSAAEIRRVLDVNLVAPFLTSQAFGTHMLAAGSGSIVNIASIAGLVGVADRAAYNASKHGLIGLTRTLAAEWGHRGVRTNAVCPGWVKTAMDDTDQAAGYYSDADITSRIPMGRFAFPDDVAKAVAFLADPEQSGFVNGAALAVDGGWTSDGGWQSLRDRHRAR